MYEEVITEKLMTGLLEKHVIIKLIFLFYCLMPVLRLTNMNSII